MDAPKAEVMKYVNMVIERKYLYVILSLCIMSVIIWGSYFIPKKYMAKSTIFIESNVIEELVKGIAVTPSMQARIQVLRETMLGRSLVLSVLQKLDLDTEASNNKQLEMLINKFQSNTKIDVNKNSLINISFEHKNPQLARDYINNLVSSYVENNVFAKREEAYDATKFLDKQVAFFKEKMDRGDEAIVKFRQEQGIYVAMDEHSLINEINNYNAELENIRIRTNELIATKNSLEQQLKNEKMISVNMFTKKETGDTLKALENRLRQLMISYTDNYPEVIKVKAEIEALRKQQSAPSSVHSDNQNETGLTSDNRLYQEVKQKTIETEAEINALNAKKIQLASLIKEKEAELKNIPESKKKLNDLEKEKNSFKIVYERLLERLGQSEVSKQMEIEDKTTTFRIIEPAILPTIPVSPNRILFILGGIAAGLLGSAGLIFLLDYMDNSVKTIDALKTLGLPVLAVIPTIESDEDVIKKKKKDTLLYGVAGIYMLCILGVLAMEILGISLIDKLISGIFIKRL